MEQKTACVTGATGLVGRHIVNQLLERGYLVKVLSRTPYPEQPNIAGVRGGLDDVEGLVNFVMNADAVFHCAAENKDTEKMHEVNVIGTNNLLSALSRANPTYFCYLSSAAVIGRTRAKHVDENTPCQPRNQYEQTKWEAEQLIKQAHLNCRTVILRPTQIFDQAHTDPINYLLKPTLANRCKIMLKGQEYSQIVHAHNVAAAALYFLDHNNQSRQSHECYIVSQDGDPDGTVKQLANTYGIKPRLTLPAIFPYLLRRLRYKTANWGNIHYSAAKLLSQGFTFPMPLKLAVMMAQNDKTPVLTMSSK